MDDHIVSKLVELNRSFYDRFADDFAASRSTPQAGFYSILRWVPPEEKSRLLDVGCGNGRLASFLREAGRRFAYTGVDFSVGLLGHATVAPGDRLLERDLVAADALEGVGTFDTVFCLSTLQHIPGQANRLSLVRQMAACLTRDGVLVLGNWQFADSDRQRRKIRSWAEAGLSDKDVEPGDYLLSWQRGGYGLRYVSLIDEQATAALATAAKLELVEQFRADGREGNLNLYTVLRRQQQAPGV